MFLKAIATVLMASVWAGNAWSESDSPIVFQGVCDASAAFFDSKGQLVVADDQTDVVQVYALTGGTPVGNHDMYPYTGTNRYARRNFSAFEAVAAQGEDLFFLTSHARERRSGANRPRRRKFFAVRSVEVEGVETFQLVGAAYKNLHTSLSESPELKRFGIGNSIMDVYRELPHLRPDKSGIMMQALAAGQDGKSLWIGLRNPRRAGRAIVIPFFNPLRVVLGVANPKFGKPVLLDLGGYGISDMLLDRTRNVYWIVAGPHDKRGLSRLYRWSGSESESPVRMMEIEPSDFETQAIALSDSGRMLLLSDDGDGPFEVEGRAQCKRNLAEDGTCACHDLVDESRKRFRGQWVSLPSDPSEKQ